MVTGWKGFPRWAMAVAPVVGLVALCLVALYGSGTLHQAPSSFGVDGQGRLYLAMDEGIMLAKADGTLRLLPLAARHAVLTISETDQMTVAANGTLMTVDLTAGNPTAGDLRVIARAEDGNSRTFFAIQRAARRVERGGKVYWLRRRLLRYEIVQSAGGSETLLYRMPAADYAGLLLCCGLMVAAFVLPLAVILSVRRRARDRGTP